MSEFSPGGGWRELGEDDVIGGNEYVLHGPIHGGPPRRWVREKPMPPLPIEPYTVIRVTWNDGPSSTDVLTLVGGRWDDYTAGNLGRNITGFEVLAEPRAVTAKAVLDRVREALPLGADRFSQDYLTLVAREFGVDE